MSAPFAFHVWLRIPQASIAIADPQLQIAHTRAQELDIDPGRVSASLSDLLKAVDELDFVDIATLRHAHCKLTKLAPAHGLHVLCQKPFAHPGPGQSRDRGLPTCWSGIGHQRELALGALVPGYQAQSIPGQDQTSGLRQVLCTSIMLTAYPSAEHNVVVRVQGYKEACSP